MTSRQETRSSAGSCGNPPADASGSSVAADRENAYSYGHTEQTNKTMYGFFVALFISFRTPTK